MCVSVGPLGHFSIFFWTAAIMSIGCYQSFLHKSTILATLYLQVPKIVLLNTTKNTFFVIKSPFWSTRSFLFCPPCCNNISADWRKVVVVANLLVVLPHLTTNLIMLSIGCAFNTSTCLYSIKNQKQQILTCEQMGLMENKK